MSASGGGDEVTPTFTITISGDGVNVKKTVDVATATEILAVVMGGAGGSASTARAPKRPARTRAAKPAGSSTKSKPKRRAGSPSVVKDLTLRPKGKTAFVDFVATKQPKTHQQKQAVILYWLRHEGGVAQGITTGHVNTCYVEANWPRPADLNNALQVTAKVKGWFDTSDMSNIRLTTRGEDEVGHNLPPKPKKK
jgi:hypothetical protein